MYGKDRDGSTAVLTEIEALMQSERYKEMYDVSRSNAAITYTMTDAAKDKARAEAEAKDVKEAWLLTRPFQLVLGLHRSRSQILEYFDLQPCKVRLMRVSTRIYKACEKCIPCLCITRPPALDSSTAYASCSLRRVPAGPRAYRPQLAGRRAHALLDPQADRRGAALIRRVRATQGLPRGPTLLEPRERRAHLQVHCQGL